MKDTLFIFFNGGGLTFDQWYKLPYTDDSSHTTTDLIERIKQIGDILLYNPVFYYDGKLQQQFKLKHLNLAEHCETVFNQTEPYNHYFLISHSRGCIFADQFISMYGDKVIGYINFDGGETQESIVEVVNGLENYSNIGDPEISTLIDNINDTSNNDNKKSVNELSNIVKYNIYKQCVEKPQPFQYTCKTIIFNNIYDSDEINIKMSDYVEKTLQNKFKYNAQFRENKYVESKWYVQNKKYGHFVLLDTVKRIGINIEFHKDLEMILI
jgi:hypothetical protein